MSTRIGIRALAHRLVAHSRQLRAKMASSGVEPDDRIGRQSILRNVGNVDRPFIPQERFLSWGVALLLAFGPSSPAALGASFIVNTDRNESSFVSRVTQVHFDVELMTRGGFQMIFQSLTVGERGFDKGV